MNDYKPNMTKREREERVLRQLRNNATRSRQASDEWQRVVTLYEDFLESASGQVTAQRND